MSEQYKYQEKFDQLKCCVLIPTYNNASKIRQVIQDVLQYTKNVLVVNDGSTDETTEMLKEFSKLEVISYSPNKGKGNALRTGFEKCLANGFDYTITIDSDGQHQAKDLPVFLEALEQSLNTLFVGARNMGQDSVPGASSFGHWFSNFWFRVETGIDLPDTQSGYRLYPLKPLSDMRFFTTKYEFEIEVLVRAAWSGIPVAPVPIEVIYPEDRITHFRKVRDFSRFSVLNTILVLIMLLYIKPRDFFRNFKKENRRTFIRKHILMSHESNGRIAQGVALGIFMGIVPIWGYQIIAAIALAHLLKLNKVLVVAASHISIPPMIPFLIYASFWTGGLLLGTGRIIPQIKDMNFEMAKADFLQYVVGSLGFGAALGVCLGLLTYVILTIFRKPSVAA